MNNEFFPMTNYLVNVVVISGDNWKKLISLDTIKQDSIGLDFYF